MQRWLAFILLALLLAPASLAAAEWGHLTMRFVYDGQLPVAKPIPAAAGPAGAGCGKGPFVEERVIVNPKDKGVANICVWLLRTSGESAPSIHESYAKTARDKVTMTNKNCRFEPRILVDRTTQTLVGTNGDPTGHNMKASFFSNPEFNENIPAGSQILKSVAKPESAPSPVSCGMHPWMGGYLIVRDDPYAAVSDASGKLTIANLPVGQWTFVVWHESGYITKAKQGGKAQDWGRNGRMKFAIQPGEN